MGLPHRERMSLYFQTAPYPRNLPTTQTEEVGGAGDGLKVRFTTPGNGRL